MLPTTGPGGVVTSIHTAPFKDGDYAVIQCNLGYTQSAPFRARFTNGAWDPPHLNCVPVSCGEPPIPDHGTTSHREFVFPKSFSYVCDEGYRLNQALNTFYCGTMGAWTPPIRNVQCNPVQCPDLKAPSNGSMVLISRDYGSVATFTCDPSFTMVRGEAKRECQSDGKWSGEDVVCEQVQCPTPIANILVMSDSLAILDCGQGKSVTMRCLPTGRWSLSPPYCPQPPDVKPPPQLPPRPPDVQLPPPQLPRPPVIPPPRPPDGQLPPPQLPPRPPDVLPPQLPQPPEGQLPPPQLPRPPVILPSQVPNPPVSPGVFYSSFKIFHAFPILILIIIIFLSWFFLKQN